MARNKGASRGVKTAIIIVLILLLLAGGIVSGILFLGNHSSELPDVERGTKLATPKNVAISDDWILTFDGVDRAVGYYIRIDGEKTLTVGSTETSVDVSGEVQSVGLHSFTVCAKHSIASFNSDFSEIKQKARYLTLDTPTSVSLSALLFSWGRVAEAKSYELLLTDDLGNETKMYTMLNKTEFNLEEYVANNSEMKYFSVQVRASPYDIVYNTTNEYIYESDYSGKLYYYKANTIQNPEIVGNFGDVTYVSDSRSISWTIKSDEISSEYVDYFEIWFDGRCITKIANSDFINKTKYTFNMDNFSVTKNLGQHDIYIKSIPKAEISSEPRISNTLRYSVRDKLATVDRDSIKISKEGDYLVFNWEGDSRAASYSLDLLGKASVDADFFTFENVTGVTGTRYTINLNDLQSVCLMVCAKVQAVGLGYYDDADWSDVSEIFSTVTQLNTVGQINTTVVEDSASVTLSWEGQNANALYKNYVGGYTVYVYSVKYEGSVAKDVEQVYTFNLDSNSESVVISDTLSNGVLNNGESIPAGWYRAYIVTMPNSRVLGYYTQSERAQSDVFEYKTRLATPSKISLSRDIDTQKLTLSFVGSVGAGSYRVMVNDTTSSSTETVASFTIAQPSDYAQGNSIIDTESINNATTLSNNREPKTYKIIVTAIAQDGQTALLNSNSGDGTYYDMFKHSKVTNINFTQDANSNKWTASWDSVSTVTDVSGYSYVLYKKGQENAVASGTANATNIDLTEQVKNSPGVYTLKVICNAITTKYYASDEATSSETEYYHYVMAPSDLEMSFVYQEESEKIRVSIPHFDTLVTVYKIKFGDHAPVAMNISADKETVYYDADTSDLPLYNNVKVTISAGSGQEYFYGCEISQQFTNDYSKEGADVTYAYTEATNQYDITFTLKEGAKDYTSALNWDVTLNGRLIYSAQITSDKITDETMTYNLNDILANGASLSAGAYVVSAVVVYKSGLKSTASTEEFTVGSGLPGIENLTYDEENFSYIQWDAVAGAVDYSVTVKHNNADVSGFDFPWSELTVDNKKVIRVNTSELFATKGAGTYEFTVKAISDSQYISGSEEKLTVTISKNIASPVFEILKDSKGIYAHILTSSLAESYRVTVNGFKVTTDGAQVEYVVTKDKGEGQYVDIYLTELTDAGEFSISVVAVPSSTSGRTESAPSTKTYKNTITADRPNNVVATQITDGIKVAWENKEYSVWAYANGSATSTAKSQTIKFTVSTLTGEFYKDSDGNAIEFSASEFAGTEFKYSTETTDEATKINGLLDFLNAQKQSVYLVYFVATVDSEYVLDSVQVPARLAYQVTLKTPSVALNDTTKNRLVESGSENLAFTISNLDTDANGVVDVEIYYTDADNNTTVVTTLYAQKLTATATSGEYIYYLNSSALSNCAGGKYSIKVRASQNGVYKASGWSNSATFYYAKKVGEVSNIRVSKTADENELNVSFTGVSVACNYSVQMIYSDGTNNYTYNFTNPTVSDGKYTYTLDYSDATIDANTALQSAWGQTGKTLNFTITATPTEDYANIAEKQETKYTYSVGTVATPTNFNFTQSGANITVTWDGDANYPTDNYETTYVVKAKYKDNAGTETESLSYTFTVPTENETTMITSPTCTFGVGNSSAAYLITFEIVSISVKETGAGASAELVAKLVGEDGASAVTVYWVNTQPTSENASVGITYNQTGDDSGKYVVTVNHGSNNGSVFSGQKYTVFVDDNLIAEFTAGNGNSTQYEITDDDTIAKLINIANFNKHVSYKLIVSDATVTQDGTTFVGYSGKTYESTLDLPIVITQAPSVILDTISGIATWTPVTNASTYTLTIKDSTKTIKTYENISLPTDSSVVTCDFSTTWKTFTGGEYTIEVAVNSDSDNDIYTKGAKFSQEVTKKNTMTTTTPAFTTSSNKKGDFQTVISWTYANQNNQSIDINKFILKMTSLATGTEYELDSTKITFAKENTYTSYTLLLCGRDLTDASYPLAVTNGYDPTRSWTIGEYVLSLQVRGDDNYYLDSEIAYAQGGNYVNKFGVAKISENSNAFNVAPECYFTPSSVDNGVINFSTSDSDVQNKKWLASYEKEYGFNRKYLVISETGETLNLATNYKVYINGTALQSIGKQGESIDFDKLQKYSNKLLLSGWNAGENTITIMPTTTTENAKYYYYLNGINEYSLDSAEAIEALTTEYTVKMYKKFSTPTDPRLNIEYNDTYKDIAKHNVSKVNVTFANSGVGYLYNVVMCYNDYYGNVTAVTKQDLGHDILVNYTTTQNDGLALYDYLSSLGPHKIWFVVKQTGEENLENADYYIDSDEKETDAFEYTTSVQEFADEQANTDKGEREVSVVSALTEDTENAEYDKNGFLKWSLPKHAYSIQICYTVTMRDGNQSYENAFSTYLSVIVVKGEDGAIKTTYSLSDNTLFHIYNDYLYFDMTKYFANDSSVMKTSRSADKYYLAGEYYYKISADAYDKNKQQMSRIYDPQYEYGFKKFVYQNIDFPVSPSDVQITYSEGKSMLSWAYDKTTSAIYTNAEAQFVVIVENYKASDNTLSKTYTLDPTTDTSIDLTDYLVAGGNQRNKVYVYRVAPNKYYKESTHSPATFVNYPDKIEMPNISAEWSDASTIKYTITEDIDTLRRIANDLYNNGASAQYVISVLRLSTDEAIKVDGNATFEDVKSSAYAGNVTIASEYTFAPITIDDVTIWSSATTQTDRTSTFDLLKKFSELSIKTQWISEDRLIPGMYFAKVELQPVGHEFYTTRTANATNNVKALWRIISEADTTLTGQFLTTKGKTETTATPTGDNARNWAEADHKEAKLNFQVVSLKGMDGKMHLPTNVTVRVKLWNGSSYSADYIYEYKYTLPDISPLGISATEVVSDDGNSVITKVSGSTYSVTIDIHDLFDSTGAKPNASDYAGVYHLDWVLNEDDVGGESQAEHPDNTTWYSYTRDICHYTAIQTPILDYRMDVQKAGADYYYVLNWALTPNKYSYAVNDTVDYNVNIFAFAEQSDGSYACDVYDTLSESEKKLFLQNASTSATAYGFELEKYITNFSTKYTRDYTTANGEVYSRRCYINEPSNLGLELTPNHSYKFFMYLSPRVLTNTNDPNSAYYLNSETSAPQEYIYKTISPAFSSASVTLSQGDQCVVEGQSDFNSEKVYNVSASQYYNGINNAFELFVYDTQDSTASSNPAWADNQEANETYLAHYIIKTLDNSSSAELQPLYVLENYKDGKPGEYTYMQRNGKNFQVGELKNTTDNGTVFTSIVLYEFALSDLLGENGNANIPITYYCKIKTWIDNNEVNKNADFNNDGVLEGLTTIYGEDWIRQYITNDDESVGSYLNGLQSKILRTGLGDFNAMNQSLYFTFQHTIRFAKPEISKIEILNNTDSSDVAGDCAVVYETSNSGVTSGYITADSDENYYFKIYLNNVYSENPIVRADKYIKLEVTAYPYNEYGNIDLSGTPSESRTATFKLHYEDNGLCYIKISADADAESGVNSMFFWIDSLLPNKLNFTATAVMGNPNQKTATDGTNVGGANVDNKFILLPSSSNVTYQKMERSFVDSELSTPVSMIVRKQYSAPQIALRYDNITSTSLVSKQYTNKTTENYETNVLSSGQYQGLALNPYLYVDGNAYASIGAQGGANGYEYNKLSYNADTKYELVLTYGDRTSEPILFSTATINNTMKGFTNAVANQTKWYYDYNNYKDIYPYADACLYTYLKDFINQGIDESAYHGGIVGISIRVVAPDDNATAGYWVSSTQNKSLTFAFSIRLDTVKTDFNANDAQFADTDGLRHLATMYAQNGYYYYYQSQIPFSYYTISKDVNYRVSMTRTNADGSSLVYSYDTLKSLSNQASGQDKAVWSPSNTTKGDKNSGNLADLLSQDLFGSDYTSASKNQWLLGGVWKINILAYADSTLNNQFVTRGFDSDDSWTYQPKLQIVNDIQDISITFRVNATTGAVQDFKSEYESMITYRSDVAKNGNLSASKVSFTYSTNNVTNATTQTPVTINEDYKAFPKRYVEFIKDFINKYYIDDRTVIGGKYNFSLKFIVDDSMNNGEFLVGSDETATFVFEYYKQLNESEISVTAEQKSSSDAYITLTGSVAKINTITSMEVALVQTVLGSTTQSVTKSSMTVTTSGDSYNFSITSKFNVNYADCFSTTTYSKSEATKLTTQGYVSSANKGTIQAGWNTFRFYPTQSSSDSKYNVLPKGFYVEKTAKFIVPSSLCPTVSLTPTTETSGGGSETRSKSVRHSCSKTRTRYYEVSCDNCGGSGEVVSYYSHDFWCGASGSHGSASAEGCVVDTWVDCGTCGGSGNGQHYDSAPDKTPISAKWICNYCGDTIDASVWDFADHYWGTCSKHKCESCNGAGGEWQREACPSCGGYGRDVPVMEDCGTCGGDGKVTESNTVTCTTCGGDGYYYTTSYYTYNLAYYRYITRVTASYTYNGGCTVNASWSYGWTPGHSGSCTKNTFSSSGTSSSMSELSSGISFSNTNYVNFNITINCKQYFGDYFARNTATASLSKNYASDHYEAYS